MTSLSEKYIFKEKLYLKCILFLTSRTQAWIFFFFFESMRERKKEKIGDVGKGEMGVGESFSTSLSTLPKSVFPTAIEALGP
jgi:hypothetical protein